MSEIIEFFFIFQIVKQKYSEYLMVLPEATSAKPEHLSYEFICIYKIAKAVQRLDKDAISDEFSGEPRMTLILPIL
ncbi:hypothetical protein JGUZn3_15770 [Entomobacter blattae]|uniref:Uncharacterized protein n=1 Tax=Entomobacter blattae TaxID=2762277 RepID=A0A7H1NSP0_9PROT|nr:hypothetical protein JGUZn3_15770 [Entomobacter blattae]